MSGAEETAPEGRDFKAAEVDLGESGIPGVSRERLAEIDREFFEAHKKQMQDELEHTKAMLEMDKEALEKAKSRAESDEFQLPDHVEFMESRVAMWEEIQGVIQANLDRDDRALARLDEEAGAAA